MDREMKNDLGTCKICNKRPLWCTCLYPEFTGEDDHREPSNIILAGTTGDDYSVLDKVDPRVKALAVEGKLDNTIRVENIQFISSQGSDIQEATQDTLDAAAGPTPHELTAENKYWILKQLGFIGKGHGQFRHIILDGDFHFDLKHEILSQIAFRIYKAGYVNAHNEINSQQKRTV